MEIDWKKIEDNNEKIDAEIIGFTYPMGDGHDLEVEVNGKGVLLMALLASAVKCISEEYGYTPEKVIDDLRANYHYLITEESLKIHRTIPQNSREASIYAGEIVRQSLGGLTMTSNEWELVSQARMIVRYCKKHDCNDCVFRLKSGREAGLCAFEFMTPQEWHLPRPRRADNGR